MVVLYMVIYFHDACKTATSIFLGPLIEFMRQKYNGVPYYKSFGTLFCYGFVVS